MNTLLKDYYHIDYHLTHLGYFHYHDTLYYITTIKNQENFLTLYSIYNLYINQLSIKGFKIVLNIYNQYYTKDYILFQYTQTKYSLTSYLTLCLQPLYLPPLSIHHIKEQWIEKIDNIRCKINEYTYKDNQELTPYIQYYLGLAETSIQLINEIIKYNKKATVPLSLSFQHPITYTDYDLLNPTYYVISSRIRMIVTLLKSEIIKIDDLSIFIPLLSLEELLYFYARLLYPSFIFDSIIHKTFEINDHEYYRCLIEKEIKLYKDVYHFLTTFISLPKIYWINN